MTTKAQKLARERNWNKAQIINLIGITIRMDNSLTTTKIEHNKLLKIRQLANNILSTWNKNQ